MNDIEKDDVNQISTDNNETFNSFKNKVFIADSLIGV